MDGVGEWVGGWKGWASERVSQASYLWQMIASKWYFHAACCSAERPTAPGVANRP